jgi:hypothetical protein
MIVKKPLSEVVSFLQTPPRCQDPFVLDTKFPFPAESCSKKVFFSCFPRKKGLARLDLTFVLNQVFRDGSGLIFLGLGLKNLLNKSDFIRALLH